MVDGPFEGILGFQGISSTDWGLNHLLDPQNCLLNKIYSKVYDYDKNIRPAPDPYYLLDKFYGNLSIQEYRKLLSTEHMLMIIEKPMTRILPELHEDNDGISSINNQNQDGKVGVYRVKRQSEKKKGPSKNEIMKENFGF